MGYQSRREFIIRKIRATLSKAKKEDVVIDEEKLITEICFEFHCSRRTAQDYIRTAKQTRLRYLK